MEKLAYRRLRRSNYKVIEEIGKGASGRVYKVDNKIEGGTFALKVKRESIQRKGEGKFQVVEKNDKMNDEESMGIEIDCLKRMKHANLVNL